MTERVILVTGAGSGIGAAVCETIAGPHTTLIIHTGSNKDGLEVLQQKLHDKQCTSYPVVGDLTDPAVSEKIVNVVNELGQLDGIVSNAGFPDWRDFGELDDAGLAYSFQVIQAAFYRLITMTLPMLKKSPSGRVVAVSSFLAHKYQNGGGSVPASAAAKAGLEALVKSLAVHVADKSVTVNCVVPGYIKKNSPDHTPLSETSLTTITSRIPLCRLGTPSEAADLIDFLLSHKASYITGQCIHIDGGLTL
jgi:NAD(P)-dependent dehydrogenase (short-subunit alcohol dehydrogenase family)